jgi:hypothetical protein
MKHFVFDADAALARALSLDGGKPATSATSATIFTPAARDVAKVAIVAAMGPPKSKGAFQSAAGLAAGIDPQGNQIDLAEREAIAIEMGGVPEAYAKAFAAIQAYPPANVPQERWRQFINDAGIFLDRWGQEAARHCWRSDELFGLHPTAPMARYDRMGLLWMLRGQSVTELTDKLARLSDGLAYRRRQSAFFPHRGRV